jgi:hypothetical protein
MGAGIYHFQQGPRTKGNARASEPDGKSLSSCSVGDKKEGTLHSISFGELKQRSNDNKNLLTCVLTFHHYDKIPKRIYF